MSTANADEATTLTQLRMVPIHESAVQLRVEAVALAIQAHGGDKMFGARRRGDDGVVDDARADDALLTTARAIHGFLTETAATARCTECGQGMPAAELTGHMDGHGHDLRAEIANAEVVDLTEEPS